MNVKLTAKRTANSDVPYDPRNKAATLEYWKRATAHRGVAELRAKHGRPTKPQIALRVYKDVLEWYRHLGPAGRRE